MFTKILACGLALLCGLPTSTSTPPVKASLVWKKDFAEAFAAASERDTIVFLAINMDGERANDMAAKKLYHDKQILSLSATTVNLVASRFEHAKSGLCPRFGSLSCAAHQQVERKARTQIFQAGPKDSVVAPHHIFLDKNAKVLLSVPYEINSKELAWCFTAALRKAYPERKFTETPGARAPKRLVMAGVIASGDANIRPLSDEEVEATIRRMRSSNRFEQRVQDVYSLIATDHPDAIKAVGDNLKAANAGRAWAERSGRSDGKDAGKRLLEGRINLIHRIGIFSPSNYWEAVATQLEDSEAIIRQESAVALEQLASAAAVKKIRLALKKEENADVRRCLVRALGTCGAEDSSARKQLSSLLKAKREPQIQRNALFALGGQVAQKSVSKTLEAILLHGPPEQRQAVLLGIAFARNSSLEPLLHHLDSDPEDPEAPAPEALETATKNCLELAQQVFEGANLGILEAKIQDLLGDTISRERFFRKEG